MRQIEKDIRIQREKRYRGSRKKINNKRLGREKKGKRGQTRTAEKEGKAGESTL